MCANARGEQDMVLLECLDQTRAGGVSVFQAITIRESAVSSPTVLESVVG